MPAGGAFGGGGEERFFAARGGERDDASDAEFGGFFDGPFEGVEFDDGEEKSCFERGMVYGKLFDEFEVDFVAGDGVNAAEPDRRTIAEFVELARLRTEDAAEVVSGFALHRGALVLELIDKEAAAHL